MARSTFFDFLRHRVLEPVNGHPLQLIDLLRIEGLGILLYHRSETLGLLQDEPGRVLLVVNEPLLPVTPCDPEKPEGVEVFDVLPPDLHCWRNCLRAKDYKFIITI